MRDAGVLAGKKPGEKIGRLTKDQIELARVQRRLTATEQRLRIWEVALAVMGKTHELLEELSKSSRDASPSRSASTPARGPASAPPPTLRCF